MTTHYQTLGLPPTAELAEIQAAYRSCLAALRESLQSGQAADPLALDRVRAAWHVLGDPDRRADYDRSLPSAPSSATLSTTSTSATHHLANSPTGEPFRFTGSGGEYFGIWIVNLLLTVLTFGIYSAWAKVRREKYFHRHVQLDGSPFEYHGTASAILKGRALLFVLLVLLSIAEKVSPALYGGAVLAFALALPWLTVRALRFRAHNTSFRGLRFRFTGTYRDAATVILGYGLLVVLTLGLALPLFLQRLRVFTLNHTHFGTAPLSCRVTAGAFYRIFATPAIAGVVTIALIGLLVATGMKGAANLVVLLGLSIPLVFLLLGPYLRARMTNAVWNATSIADGQFKSSLGAVAFVRLQLVNWVATLLTLGLFWPWAAVRNARIRAENLALHMPMGLDHFVAGESTQSAALGDEVADAIDLDLGA